MLYGWMDINTIIPLVLVSVICLHACSKIIPPLVNDAVVRARPKFQNSLLDDTTYLVVEQFEVGVVRWSQI